MFARMSSGPPCCTSSPLTVAASARLQSARDRLLVVAKLQRGKSLKKQREGHDPGIASLAAQRQRLGGEGPNLDVASAKCVHVRQTNQGARSEPARRVIDGERLFEP